MINKSKNNESKQLINELKKTLNDILISKGSKRGSLLKELENQLNSNWDKNKDVFEEKLTNVLNDLLNDLAYYQPITAIRITDKNLIDDAQLDNLIRNSLEKINKIQKQ